MKKRTTSSVTVTVPRELLPQIKAMALASGRTVSSYIGHLIRHDAQALQIPVDSIR